MVGRTADPARCGASPSSPPCWCCVVADARNLEIRPHRPGSGYSQFLILDTYYLALEQAFARVRTNEIRSEAVYGCENADVWRRLQCSQRRIRATRPGRDDALALSRGMKTVLPSGGYCHIPGLVSDVPVRPPTCRSISMTMRTTVPRHNVFISYSSRLDDHGVRQNRFIRHDGG